MSNTEPDDALRIFQQRFPGLRFFGALQSGLLLVGPGPTGRQILVRALGPFDRRIDPVEYFGTADATRRSSSVLHYWAIESTAAESEADGLGAIYTVRPYAPTTLEDRLRTGRPMDAPRAQRLAVSLARALSELHSSGLVHGSVQPSNVAAIGGRWYLLDHGVSELASVDEGGGRGSTTRDLQQFASLLSELVRLIPKEDRFYRQLLSEIVAVQLGVADPVPAPDLVPILRKDGPSLQPPISSAEQSELVAMASELILNEAISNWNLRPPRAAVRDVVDAVLRRQLDTLAATYAAPELFAGRSEQLAKDIASEARGELSIFDRELMIVDSRLNTEVDATEPRQSSDELHSLSQSFVRRFATSTSRYMRGREALIQDGFLADQLEEMGFASPDRFLRDLFGTLASLQSRLESEPRVPLMSIQSRLDPATFSLSRLVEEDLLIAWSGDSGDQLLTFQLDPATLQPRPEVLLVNQELRAHDDNVGMALWWLNESPWLGDSSPKQALLNDSDPDLGRGVTVRRLLEAMSLDYPVVKDGHDSSLS